jgi:hypothetical protein
MGDGIYRVIAESSVLIWDVFSVEALASCRFNTAGHLSSTPEFVLVVRSAVRPGLRIVYLRIDHDRRVRRCWALNGLRRL